MLITQGVSCCGRLMAHCCTAGSSTAASRIWPETKRTRQPTPSCVREERKRRQAATKDGSRLLVVDSDKSLKARQYATCCRGPVLPCRVRHHLNRIGHQTASQVFDVHSHSALPCLPESDAVTSVQSSGIARVSHPHWEPLWVSWAFKPNQSN